MSRRRTPISRNQRVFLIMSILVVISLIISLLISFTPRPPQVTVTPIGTAPLIFTPTPSPTPF